VVEQAADDDQPDVLVVAPLTRDQPINAAAGRVGQAFAAAGGAAAAADGSRSGDGRELNAVRNGRRTARNG
jgi:hypothetical protein